MNDAVIHEIAERLYSLLVVNTRAAGIQQPDGRYITRYFSLTPLVIENMIKQHGSMGCYQQIYRSGYIRWICFDFDCVDKSNPDVEGLLNKVVLPFAELLKTLNINYLMEFSGRRGIHVWIVFNHIFSKATGFQILNKIYDKFIQNNGELDSALWGLDKFPATSSAKHNIVGKLVKVPLSSHAAGGMSYFFDDTIVRKSHIGTASFFQEQLDILNNYCENTLSDVISSLGMEHEIQDSSIQYRFRTYHIFESIDITTSQVRDILSKTSVFRQIFSRMMRGYARREDWTVLLGTLSRCDPDSALLKAVLQEFPCYDAEKTSENIKRLRNRYYPATFGYLYQLYNLSPEEDIDLAETGFSYLMRALGVETRINNGTARWNERNTVLCLEDTIEKEKNYFMYNDEVPDVLIYNELDSLNSVDCYRLSEIYEEIVNMSNVTKYKPEDYCVFERFEESEINKVKIRKLVSLSAKDRVLTTHLALRLCLEIGHRWKSFSYHPALTSRKDIFFLWYESWRTFLKQVRTFIEIPFFKNYRALFIDLKSFYDTIDLLAVYRSFESSLNDNAKRVFEFLTSFNDELMNSIHGNRLGVPQGPAYARIIAELFLDRVLDTILPERTNIHLYRYVDDIVVFCSPDIDAGLLYEKIKSGLKRYYLQINDEKSFVGDDIENLSLAERESILHSKSFHYDLKQNDFTGLLPYSRRESITRRFFKEHVFNAEELGYIYGRDTIEETQERYFDLYKQDIFSSNSGRGSAFRSFYRYLFSCERALLIALDNHLIEMIPYPSLHFSVFINTLYISLYDESISVESFKLIQKSYLRTIILEKFKECDREKNVILSLQNILLE